MAPNLSRARCILLTVHYASRANIPALHSFTPTRLDVLEPELVLRILLTSLPETTEPSLYVKYVEEVASRLYLDYERDDVEVDTSPVADLSEEQAEKKAARLLKGLVELAPATFPPHAPKDVLTHWLCQRAYRIDEETGLLNLVPQLIEPFLGRNEWLRTWYISAVLPLVRLDFEYYQSGEAQGQEKQTRLRDFESLDGKRGVDLLLGRAEMAAAEREKEASAEKPNLTRDVRGLVGPWQYGHAERKRRKLDHPSEQRQFAQSDTSGIENRMRKISLSGVSEEDKTGHDWEYMYQWLVAHASTHFPMVLQCVEEWEGPSDVDLAGLNEGGSEYLDEELQRKLELQYAQAAFATCYAVEADTEETVRGAHAILARLAELLDFIPPPDLASSVDALPKIERHASKLDESSSSADLEPAVLLRPEHPLTTPRLETYMLLQMIVYSAYQLSGLGHPLSLVNVAKLHIYAGAEEQFAVLQKILRGLAKSGARKDEAQWTSDRAKLMWLWNWGMEQDDEDATTGAGVLGKIGREQFEKEMLKVFTETSCYELAIKLYLEGDAADTRLPKNAVEIIVLQKAMEAYDGASNGNRTRGGVRKANDIITAFRPYFPASLQFRQASALIAATHALSFYSLTLQHGVPFQPVSIRVSHDPVGLVDRVLEQNPRSYTKLDDLIGISQNLVSAGLQQQQDTDREAPPDHGDDIADREKDAERRVTFMAVEAALREDDFETAYSYIVNRLTPSGADVPAPKDAKPVNQRPHKRVSSRSSESSTTNDDISWRAAFLAGRFRPTSSTPPTLRRLEQRTELLSLALLLAPTSALTEILAAWRRCEEETTALQMSQQQAEEEFDDHADKRMSTSALPGNFTVGGEQPEMILNQKRREMGRMSAVDKSAGKSGSGEGEAPMSMFDLTRSAAQAFGRNAFPLHGGASRPSAEMDRGTGLQGSVDSLASDASEQRVRKRDYVANAVSGGLASGLGWVLGATPVDRQAEHGHGPGE